MMNLIEIKNLKWQYADDFHLELDSFTLKAGESWAITGPSGSGKSTLLKLMAGELNAKSGQINCKDRIWQKLSARARQKHRLVNVGRIFQEPRLLEWMSVRQNIILPLQLSGRKADSTYLQKLAQTAGIADKLDRRPSQISQGEQQRAALLRALIGKPPIILADEPTASLDRDSARQMTELLIDCCRQSQCGLVFVTHDLGLLDMFDHRLSSSSWLSGGERK